MNPPNTRIPGFVIVVLFTHVPTAYGTTYDTRPRPTHLLPKSSAFVAQNAWNSVAMYSIKDGQLIHAFPAKQRINHFDVSADEQFLVAGCADGSVGVWGVGSGTRLWWKSAVETKLSYVYDVSFAQNGKSLIVCDAEDSVAIFETQTGSKIGTVSPSGFTSLSAALSPDGSKGFLVTIGEHLLAFDTATGTASDTGLTGGHPIRFSSDGKYIAMRSSNWGSGERLRIVSIDHESKIADVGQLGHIGHIRPTGDGCFVATARTSDLSSVGVHYAPQPGKLTEIWRSKQVRERTDFDPEAMVGADTDFRLITHLTDLRTGNVLHTLDNSANARLEMVSSSSRGLVSEIADSTLVALLVVMVLIGMLALLIRWFRKPA